MRPTDYQDATRSVARELSELRQTIQRQEAMLDAQLTGGDHGTL